MVRKDQIVGFYITSHIDISGRPNALESKQIFQVEAYTVAGDILGEEEEKGSVFIVSPPYDNREDAVEKMDELVARIDYSDSGF